MEEVIKRIIQIEEEAAEIEKRTAEKIMLSKAEQEKRLEELQQSLKKRAVDKVNTLRQREITEVEQEVKRQQEMAQKQMEHLTKIKAQNAADWTEKLFQSIIKE